LVKIWTWFFMYINLWFKVWVQIQVPFHLFSHSQKTSIIKLYNVKGNALSWGRSWIWRSALGIAQKSRNGLRN
jgi:hypothetical protein